MNPLSVVVILGTPREGRVSESVARFITNTIAARDDMTHTFFDVRSFAFPQDTYPREVKDCYADYVQAAAAADGFIIVTPEYNHSFPGSLKLLLDITTQEYKGKAVGVVGVSNGAWGGTRVIEHLAPVLRDLGLYQGIIDLNVPLGEGAFSAEGEPKDPSYHDRAKRFLDAFAWRATALRWGREQLPYV